MTYFWQLYRCLSIHTSWCVRMKTHRDEQKFSLFTTQTCSLTNIRPHTSPKIWNKFVLWRSDHLERDFANLDTSRKIIFTNCKMANNISLSLLSFLLYIFSCISDIYIYITHEIHVLLYWWYFYSCLFTRKSTVFISQIVFFFFKSHPFKNVIPWQKTYTKLNNMFMCILVDISLNLMPNVFSLTYFHFFISTRSTFTSRPRWSVAVLVLYL